MNPWSRWVALASRREPAHAVALVRIITGGAITAHYARLGFTDTWRWVWLPPSEGGLVPLNHTVLDAVGVTPAVVGGLVLAGIVSAALLTLGALTPAMAVLSAVIWALLTNLGANAGGSYDFLGGNILFLLIFAGSGGAWSLDARRRVRRGLPASDAPVWPRWLLVWQLVVMYDTTVWQKVSAGWVPGGPADALWFILQQPTWHRFDMRWLAPFYPLTQLATLVTWSFEHASPLLLLATWYRTSRTRPGWLRAQFNRVDARIPFLTLGLLLHAQIELTMEVGCFTAFTFALYAACFSGEEVRRSLSRVRREH